MNIMGLMRSMVGSGGGGGDLPFADAEARAHQTAEEILREAEGDLSDSSFDPSLDGFEGHVSQEDSNFAASDASNAGEARAAADAHPGRGEQDGSFAELGEPDLVSGAGHAQPGEAPPEHSEHSEQPEQQAEARVVGKSASESKEADEGHDTATPTAAIDSSPDAAAPSSAHDAQGDDLAAAAQQASGRNVQSGGQDHPDQPDEPAPEEDAAQLPAEEQPGDDASAAATSQTLQWDPSGANGSSVGGTHADSGSANSDHSDAVDDAGMSANSADNLSTGVINGLAQTDSGVEGAGAPSEANGEASWSDWDPSGDAEAPANLSSGAEELEAGSDRPDAPTTPSAGDANNGGSADEIQAAGYGSHDSFDDDETADLAEFGSDGFAALPLDSGALAPEERFPQQLYDEMGVEDGDGGGSAAYEADGAGVAV